MSAQEFQRTALTFTVTSTPIDGPHPMQSLIDTGAQAALTGALWYNNPYPSNTWQSYAWDKGHSSIHAGGMVQ